jgi:hypothetical protein
MVPVTTLRPVTVRQPVVTYYYPPEPVCPPMASSAPAVIPPAAGPTVEQRPASPPTVTPETIPPQSLPANPNAYPRTSSPSNYPKIRPEKTTSFVKSLVTVRGEVVMPDQITPRPGAKLVFVDADNKSRKEYLTANQFGEFDARLPAGNWYLYLGGNDGRAVYHKQVSLGDKGTYDYKVVSR